MELLSPIELCSKLAEKDDSVISDIIPLTKLIFAKVEEVSVSLSNDLADAKTEVLKQLRRLALMIFFFICP